jgi:hypothetical protein
MPHDASLDPKPDRVEAVGVCLFETRVDRVRKRAVPEGSDGRLLDPSPTLGFGGVPRDLDPFPWRMQ